MQEDPQGLLMAIKTHWNHLENRQKGFFVFFVVCAIAALVFSYHSVIEGVYSPFRVPISEIQKNRELLKDPIKEQERIAKRTDTDGDGLSDWDEEHLFHTSPYLWSTAGDGVPDNVKIALGENPLCKEGEDCTAVGAMKFDLPTTTLPGTNIQQTSVREDIGSILLGNNQVGDNFRETSAEAGVSLSVDDLIPTDPALIRKALLQTGQVTEADLEKITDAQLMQYVEEAKADALKKTPGLATTSTAATTTKNKK